MSISNILTQARKQAGDDPREQVEYLAHLVKAYQDAYRKHVSTGLLRAGKAEQPNSTKES